MTLTLLLDLDDTLLDSDMDKFVPAYFSALGKALSKYVPAEKMLKYLMQGTNAMIEKDTPEHSLEEIFNGHFYPNLGVTREFLAEEIDHFYDEIFPTLSCLTKPRPEAGTFVEWAFEQGHRVAVATNPLFPRKAIEHRLRWAGLPVDEYPFEIVTSFESCSFSKPNPAYYAGILGRMGWQDGPVLMVGDDPIRDMLGAEQLGLARYWIASPADELPDSGTVTGRGTMGDLRAWLENIDGQKMLMPQYQAQTAVVATMKSTPAVLKGLMSDIPLHPDSETRSATDILSHLRDVEREVNLPRIQTFLREDNPIIPADDTNVWIAERDHAEQDGETALAEFFAARLETLTVLHEVNDEMWQRSARHATFGQITLQKQVSFMAEHDRVHLQQIFCVTNKEH